MTHQHHSTHHNSSKKGKKSGSSRTYFKEIQHPPQWIVWLISIILLSGLALLYYYTYQMYLGETSILGYSKKFKLLLVADFILFFLVLAAVATLFNLKFVVKISSRALYFKRPPVQSRYKKIHRDRMEKVETATTNNLPSGTIKIKIKGKTGVLIVLEDERNVFIGSQHPKSLKKAVEKLIQNNYRNTKKTTQKVDEVI